MINREWQTVSVVSFTTGTDAYGQPHQSIESKRKIQMVVKIFQQTNTTDVRYNDITTIGLTTDSAITDKNQIIIGTDYYDVLYTIPSGRLTQILMRKRVANE